MNDLKEKFAKIEIVVSKPLVPFKETITATKSLDYEALDLPIGVVERKLNDNSFRVRLRVLPLPTKVQDILVNTKFPAKGQEQTYIDKLKNALIDGLADSEFNRLSFDWKEFFDHIIAFGPKSIGPNILVNRTEFKTKK